MALWDLADAAVHAGDADRARALAAEALELSRRAGFKDGEALALERLGWLALGRDDRTEAERYFQEALALQLAHDDWYAVAGQPRISPTLPRRRAKRCKRHGWQARRRPLRGDRGRDRRRSAPSIQD